MIIDRGFFSSNFIVTSTARQKKSLMHFIPSYKALHLLHKNGDKGKLHLKRKRKRELSQC